VRPVGSAGAYTGFDLVAGKDTVAVVRLSSKRLLTAARCSVSPDRRSFTFTGLSSRAGLRLGARDRVTVALRPGDPYPRVSFDLTLAAFDPARWRAMAGAEPFHFLALFLPEAEAVHQRGWLNATPLADPFPLLGDRHVGTPEISAYHYNRNWSYSPPLGANPLPVIGLWAPKASRYVGLEFQTTRLEDNSERDIATAYCWRAPKKGAATPPEDGQFVALVYPYGGTGYQQLVLPKPGAHLSSRGTLLWSRALPATQDPNRFLWSYLWPRVKGKLPPVPAAADLSWLPGRLRLPDFEAPPGPGLIGGVEGSFQGPGTRLVDGWGWKGENPSAVAARSGDRRTLDALVSQAGELERFAKRFRAGGEECVFWEKPLTGRWTDDWGGPGATSLHNANGFAAGRLFLGLYRDAGRKQYLPIVDGVLNWAKHVAWTRNEFADVPSSPFAIGGTLSAAFCLEYAQVFWNAPDAFHRARARQALDLARTFTYRYLVMWPSDNNRADSLQPAFLWEPNSGRDWTGAACSNEVFWNLDTLAQTAVMTGDPFLMWALQGSLSRWYLLYQDVARSSLDRYGPADMTEGYGLYAGNVYGVGKRAAYGFAAPLAMTEPVGDTTVRFLAGERAALAFVKGGQQANVSDYHWSSPGGLSFVIRARQPRFNLSLTAPYTDLSRQPVWVLRAGSRRALVPGRDLIRPRQALWSLTLRDLRSGDRVLVGQPEGGGPALPSLPPLTESGTPPAAQPGAQDPLRLPLGATVDSGWSHAGSWAGIPSGRMWCYGLPLDLASSAGRCVATRRVRLGAPVRCARVAVAYGAGDGPLPALILADGTRAPVDPSLEGLAWRAWPPFRTARLLVSVADPGGKAVVGVDPRGREVWAATSLNSSAARSALALLRGGAGEWRRTKQAEANLAVLQRRVESLPQDRFALLPPHTSGAGNLVLKTGLADRGVPLSPEQMVDPAFFNPDRFPAAVYTDGETYVGTVRTPGDGAEAILRYVRDGGTLLLLAAGPYPMFYATGAGPEKADPLLARLGLPLMDAVETAPTERLTMHRVAGELPLSGLPTELPYPSGDPRLRSLPIGLLSSGTRAWPLYRVVGASGKSYGEAAVLVRPVGAKGQVLYIWGGLLRDPDRHLPVVGSALTFLQQRLGRGS
jgi:hypothetical protein